VQGGLRAKALIRGSDTVLGTHWGDPLPGVLATDDHGVGRGVGADPAGQQTRVPPLARPVRGVFQGADALSSQALERFDSAGSDGLHEVVEVLLVLFGVALGEVGDRSVERVVVAEVLGDGDRIS
jgi:hypothetical protein